MAAAERGPIYGKEPYFRLEPRMSLVQIFRREANRLREMASAFASDEARTDFLNQARHYDVLANQAASRQLPGHAARSPTHH